MRKTKYVMSGGLAFSEIKDMEKLRSYSLKGWHVRDFKFMGYTLEKGAKAEYIYSVDYRSLKEGDAEEYFDFFSSSGWTHIASEGDIHLFRALPGTKPIYSDRETEVEKHGNLGSSMKWLAISLISLTVLAWIGTMISTNSLQVTLTVIAVALSVVAIPLCWTVITVYSNKSKAAGKINSARLVKYSLLSIVILASIMILFNINDSNNRALLLAYMLIGAIALPTAIWAVMSLFHKINEKKA
ncbi:DUF2812 domain-containing protein [Sediminibacillus massiliensis]|uniref:DUF2812 domain-containing protein n=1 Tax=Sediminibacillus massiliensis TaxID=1926277 RepID=UPI000988916F|nr:DUF2812 domain-containing protein [Sediminibacillus massiliensis]